MTNRMMQNTGIALLIFVALILLLFKKQGNKLQFTSFLAVGILALVVLINPLIGFIFAVPVFLVVYFDHYPEVLAWWDKMKGATIKTGGSD